MRHPERDLADYLDGELADDRRPGFERHLASCERCRSWITEHRALQERLRSLDVPAPGPDLTGRLLSAPARADAVPGRHLPPADETGPGSAAAPVRRTSPRRTLLVLCGAAAGFAALTCGTAYILGGEEPALQAAGSGGGQQWSGSAAVDFWTMGVGQKMGREDLDQLRRSGWNCPQLAGLGYELASARTMTVAGEPAVRVALEGEDGSVVVTEQRRGVERPEPAAPKAVRAVAPVNAVTGRSVAADGFRPINGMDRDMWLRAGPNWTVVLNSANVTYTVWSDAPLSDLPEMVGQVIIAEKSRLVVPRATVSDDPVSRIIRGLGKMVLPADAQSTETN
jgi:anti-sigma factor RsiW